VKREEKAEVIESIASQITEADAIYAVDYRGISVTQAANLRASLREADTNFRVVKNTLTLLAAEKAGADGVKDLVEGPTAFAFVRGDPALAAKALDQFSRRENVLELRGGLLDGQLLTADRLRQLARLPAREQLNAQLAGVVAAPITGLVRGLGGLLSGLAIALGQVRDQKPAEEPAEAPPAEAEAPAEPEAGAEAEASAEAAEPAETAPEGEPEGAPETEGAATKDSEDETAEAGEAEESTAGEDEKEA
jgi:large subunit ribosomal protein L10